MVILERLLTLEEVAERLRVSRFSVWRWVSSGQLPAVRVGPKVWRVPEPALEEYLRQRRTGAAKEGEPGEPADTDQ